MPTDIQFSRGSLGPRIEGTSDPLAVSRFERRRVAPSSRASAEWERVAPALREKCFFSARVNDAEVLGKMRELLGAAIDSSKRDSSKAIVSQDKFISEMKSFLASRGYTMGGSKLTDITSRRRLGLIYDMNVQEAREYARYVRGQDADVLDMYPAQEFVRVEIRRVPRTDWPVRWRAAGGKIRGGRMVALKSDPVWTNLSRFGRPYPPFDYGSGMGVEDIDREEAEELGLLPDDEPADEIPEFDIALEAEASLDRIPEDMVEEIVREAPNARIEDGKLKMRDKKPLPTWKDLGLEDTRKWRPSGIKFSRSSVSEAKEALKAGEFVNTPIGKIEFNEAIFKDWQKYSDEVVNDRLSYYGVAKQIAASAREVWRQGKQMTLINIYENAKGKIRGFVVVVEDEKVVRTFFVKDLISLNNARKGELIRKE